MRLNLLSLGVVPIDCSDSMMVVLFELMISSILPMEQVLDCEMSL